MGRYVISQVYSESTPTCSTERERERERERYVYIYIYIEIESKHDLSAASIVQLGPQLFCSLVILKMLGAQNHWVNAELAGVLPRRAFQVANECSHR